MEFYGGMDGILFVMNVGNAHTIRIYFSAAPEPINMRSTFSSQISGYRSAP